jgi:CheY-like chemotaxis protein
MHQAHTPLNEQDAATSPDDRAEQRKFVRKVVSVAIVASAVLITLYVWSIIERHPRTDDAAARANVVGVVPRVRGQIVRLTVQDNQLVKEGDLLFEIDPDDYELALEKAKSALAALDEHNLANKVFTVRDGAEALDYLYRRGKFQARATGNPVVVLLDLKMPKVNGLEVLKIIKADERLKAIPIVMLTAKGPFSASLPAISSTFAISRSFGTT